MSKHETALALSELQRAGLLELLSDALVFIRLFAANGDADRAGHLAHAVHNVPLGILHADSREFDWEGTRESLAEYERIYRKGVQFVAMLDDIRAGEPMPAMIMRSMRSARRA